MKTFSIALCLIAASAVTSLAGSLAGAKRVATEYKLAQLEWKQQQLAGTPSSDGVPNREQFGDQMASQLSGSLHEPWAMQYMVWILRVDPALSAEGTKYLISMAEKHHKDSPLLGEFCIALPLAGEADPARAIRVKLLQEKTRFIKAVMNSAARKSVKGQAALALSGVLARRGDEAGVNSQRLQLIRKAIIDAADAKVGDTTVAELAREEIYRISKLSKGALAPELVGTNSGGVPMKLSDYKGKIVVLTFWSSWEQAESVIGFSKKLQKTYAGKPVEVIGVNRDSLANLRKLVVAGQSVGESFTDPMGKLFHQYRVTGAPICYVLDQEGRIQYSGAPGSFVDFAVSALLQPKK